MFLKIIAGVTLIFCLVSLVYTVYFYSLKAWRSGHEKLSKLKVAKNNLNSLIILLKNLKRLKRNQIKTIILDLVTLNSKQKRHFVLYALPISFIFSIPSSFITLNKYTSWIGSLCVLITLLGIAKFLGRKFQGDLIDKVSTYYFKVSIFFIYSFGFFINYLDNPNNSILFPISLISTIIFSVYILKSIIDGFEHIGFCVINFLLVYLYDLLAIGLHFGFFYLQNNEVFKLYSNIKQYETFNLNNILALIQTGLSNFYILSSSVLDYNSLMNFVPLFEYVIGAVFNVGILGFFISYITSKIFAKEHNKVANPN